MKVQRFEHPIEFCDRAEPFLQQNEVVHNLPLRLCRSFREGSPHIKPSYLALVEVDGNPVAVAIRTPPFPLVVSEVTEPAAIALLVDDLQAAEPELAGVNAPQAVADEFARIWQQRTNQLAHLYMAMRVHKLTAVQPVAQTSGWLRLAEAGDRSLLTDWYIAFQQEALQESPELATAQAWAERQIGYQTLYLWQDGDRVVSAASGFPASARVGVVNFVYTPLEFRKRGYATTCVAAVSQRLLKQGYQACALFTDLANRTSNKIYRAIGYQPVCDWNQYRFQPKL
ncbi:MAG: GNAT family N-acetyltransferase [Oscillatoriales cyanobacterium C42_A2020_001]|nr:GNAT family N-acetyltransferase [Leptolyngbyaceae cyanobacterium C42_A2020_001]